MGNSNIPKAIENVLIEIFTLHLEQSESTLFTKSEMADYLGNE